jgi:hypothetical protein
MYVSRQRFTLKPAEESFRQGWHEVVRGETRPVSELWETPMPDFVVFKRSRVVHRERAEP